MIFQFTTLEFSILIISAFNITTINTSQEKVFKNRDYAKGQNSHMPEKK